MNLRNLSLSLALPIAITITIFAFAQTPAKAEDAKTAWVEVTGTGLATAKPDMVMLSLTVLRQAKGARQALDANNQAMAKLLTGMKAAGIAETDMQTSRFSLQPRYHHARPDKNGQRPAPSLIGYSVSNQLSVKVRQVGKAGEILDLAVSLGANTIGGVRFDVEDPSALQELARIDAMKKARSKAETLAISSGTKLGNVLSIREQNTGQSPQPMLQAKRMMQESSARVPLAGGQLSWAVGVTVRWSLAQ